MRQRTEVFVLLGGIALFLLGVAVLSNTGTPEKVDTRPSTMLAGPEGARGLLDAASRLGISVRRFRRRTVELHTLHAGPRELFVMLSPSAPISAPELRAFKQFADSNDVLLAGLGSEHLMRCLGYRIKLAQDSAALTSGSDKPVYAHASLVRTGEMVYTDSSRMMDVGRVSCTVPDMRTRVTLSESSLGPEIIRMEREDNGHVVLLAADVSLFRNRQMRETASGPLVLGLVAGKYDHITFEEYHHGFGAAGSLAGATFTWSTHSPWGWMVWQLVVVGLLMLFTAAIRFGPMFPPVVARRRSPIEHVRALATALSSARGHDEAIAAIVRGLRRRLAPPALRTRGDWRAWLANLQQSTTNPDQQRAVEALARFTTPGQSSSSVLHAADAAEDLWKTLRP